MAAGFCFQKNSDVDVDSIEIDIAGLAGHRGGMSPRGWCSWWGGRRWAEQSLVADGASLSRVRSATRSVFVCNRQAQISKPARRATKRVWCFVKVDR